MTPSPIPDADTVRNLVGRYCDAVLRADVEVLGDCWSADAEWVMPGREPIVGRDAIVATFGTARAEHRLCVQEILNGIIDGASARWQVRELRWGSDGGGGELIGVYHDDLGFGDDGVCRFTRRRFELRYRGSLELGGRLYGPSTCGDAGPR